MIEKEIAALLDGMEHGSFILKHDIKYAKENGAVIVFGVSNDLMEFRGAIDGEIRCYRGGTAYLNKEGLLRNRCNNENCPYFITEQLLAKAITAVWDINGYSWEYQTIIPHETFEIFDMGHKYCRGIVFSIDKI